MPVKVGYRLCPQAHRAIYDGAGMLPPVPCHDEKISPLCIMKSSKMQDNPMIDLRRSPFRTNSRSPNPCALRSRSTPRSDPHGGKSPSLQSGSTTPLCAKLQSCEMSQAARDSLGPNAAQTSYSSETSRSFTLERNICRFSVWRSGGASDGRASYSTMYSGVPLGVS